MKRPREEEQVSLALSLSTTDSSSTSTSASSTGSSKRRVATSGEGDFVCKTCRRAFPTFQALGGHRTSHLRGRGRGRAHSLELGFVAAKALKQHKADKGQPQHECHICGLAFEAGQALGGHVRRHREDDDWVWRTQERLVAAEPPVLLELFA